MMKTLKDVRVGDFVYAAYWCNRTDMGRSVNVEKYEVTRLTPCGFHVEIHAILRGESKHWELTEDTDLFSSPTPKKRWIGHNSRVFFADPQGAIDRLIMRRKLWVKRLKYQLKQAGADIEALKNGYRHVPNISEIFKGYDTNPP